MLAGLRAFVRSKAAMVLIGLLVLSFAVWGLSDVFAGRTGIGLAAAGDRRVLKADVERVLQNYLQSEREQGRSVSQIDAARGGVVSAIINGQAVRTAQLAYADEAGIRASAAAAARLLADAPRFRDPLTGDFDRETYRAYLGQVGESPESFETSLRDDLTTDYFNGGVESAIETPSVLARMWLLSQTETREIAYVPIPTDYAPEIADPTDAELEAFYAERQSLFTQPERRRASIVSVSPADFVDQIDVPDEDVETAYEIRLRELSGPETRVLAQISGSERSAVQEAADQIITGVSPEDAANAVEGVELAVLRVTEADLSDDVFASAAFRAPAGDVLIPMASGEGWVTAAVREIIPGAAPAFDDVAEQLRADLAMSDAERLYEAALENLFDLVGGGFELSEIAEELGAPVMRYAAVDQRATTQTGAFVGGIAALPDAMRTLFEGLEGELSDIIEDDNDGVYVLSIDEVIPQNAPPLEEIRDEVVETYIAIRKAEAIDAAGSELSTAATSLEALRAASEEKGLETIVVDAPISRAAPPQTLDPRILAQAFSVEEGAAGQTVTSTGAAVVWVETITRNDAANDPALLDAGKQVLAESLRADLGLAFRDAVTRAAELQLNEGEINSYIQSLAGEE